MAKNLSDGLPTIYDVAIRSGVSIATVSRVLNSPERVSEVSRLKVMAAIDELGFIPKADARARALQKTGRIGVVTPYFTSPSFAQRLRGVASVLSDSPYELVIYTVDSLNRLKHYYSTLPLTGSLAGLIVLSLPIDEEAAQRLVTRRLDTVLVETFHPTFSTILVDDRLGGRMAAQHLIAKGHTRCAFMHYMQTTDYSIYPEHERLAGFQEILVANNVALPEQYIHFLPHSTREIRQTLHQLFTLPEPPTAIFAPADSLAIQLLHLAREYGLRIPEDLSVIGFDDIDMAEHVGLTTINQQLEESGRIAAEMLLARVANSSRPVQRTHIKLTLVERETTSEVKAHKSPLAA